MCGCGSFIIVNRDGWILTAAHVLDDLVRSQAQLAEITTHQIRKSQIEADASLDGNRRRKKLSKLPKNPEWIMNISYFWGMPSVAIKHFSVNPVSDLATGRLEPFNADMIQEYPVFKNPQSGLLAGTSLCRLGFPFKEITATFDEATNQFTLGNGVLPVPFFPNDGIHTRVVLITAQNNQQAKFIETSSPGLRGQSGGPIFDVHGNVWAIQSRTQHLPLGFSPKIKEGSREITEHQFMHVGWGSHVEEVIKFLNENHVDFNLSP